MKAAQSGTLILVEAGEYVGDITMAAGVTLAGPAAGKTIMTGNVKLADGCGLVNLVFRNPVGPPMWTDRAQESAWSARDKKRRAPTAPLMRTPGLTDVRILFCEFRGATSETHLHMLRVDAVKDLKIIGCVFRGATETSRGELYGVHLRSCANIVIAGNEVTELSEAAWGNCAGMLFEYCSGSVTGNLVSAVTEAAWDSGFGIWIKHPDKLTVKHNTVFQISSTDWDSTFGIAVDGDGECRVESNLINEIKGKGWTAPSYGIFLGSDEAAAIYNNVSRLTSEYTRPGMAKHYAGTGGARNAKIDVKVDRHARVVSPRSLASGKSAVRYNAAIAVKVTVPSEVQLPK
jgi:hypothetical protein